MTAIKSAYDPARTFSAVPLSKQCLAVSSRGAGRSQSRVAPDSRRSVCHTTIELAVLGQLRVDEV